MQHVPDGMTKSPGNLPRYLGLARYGRFEPGGEPKEMARRRLPLPRAGVPEDYVSPDTAPLSHPLTETLRLDALSLKDSLAELGIEFCPVTGRHDDHSLDSRIPPGSAKSAGN